MLITQKHYISFCPICQAFFKNLRRVVKGKSGGLCLELITAVFAVVGVWDGLVAAIFAIVGGGV